MSGKKNQKKLLFQAPPLEGEKETCKKDYAFEMKLGDGAFGQVWKIRHKRTNKVYACKQVAKEKVVKMIEQFRREVFIMYELTHSHIIKLYHHFEDDKYFYLVMEIAEGGSLFQKLATEKSFIERQANQYFREIVDAVQYLHQHNPVIIHRDIKPENILIGDKGYLKLTDFGWSNYYSNEHATPRYTICGTFEYLSPEMVKETGHTPAVDIWCLGIFLYEMLCGYTPFKASGKDSLMENIAKGKIKFPITMSPLAKNLITKILEKNPIKRINIDKIKQHEWYKQYANSSPEKIRIGKPESNNTLNPNRLHVPTSQSPTKMNDSLSSLNSFRKSILVLKGELFSRVEVSKDLREKIKETINKTKEQEATVKVIELEILEKKKEIAEYEAKHRVLYEKISDSKMALEKLGVVHDLKAIENKTDELSIEFESKSQEIFQKTEEAAEVYVKISELEEIFTDRSRYHDNLKQYLSKIKSKGTTMHKTRQSQISDLQASYECLKTRIFEHEKQLEEIETPENKIARELMYFVKENKDKIINNTLVEDKLNYIEELTCIKEFELEKIKIEYLDAKKSIMKSIRCDKDRMSKQKPEIEDLVMKIRDRMSAKGALEEELGMSREMEIKYKMETVDIQTARDKAKVIVRKALKTKLNTVNQKILKAKNNKARMISSIEERAKNIEAIEMELGMLKSEILSIDDT